MSAQNLVSNGSFENFYSCPNSTNQVDSCIDWHLILNTPDYFASCSPYPVSVPDNFAGSQTSFEGNAYVGLYTYIWWASYREIFGQELKDILVTGNLYRVSMRVSRGNWTNDAQNQAASNKLGIRFTTFEHTISNPPSINNYAQLHVDSILTDTLGWTLLKWEFIADSQYTHFYVGNFFDDSMTDTMNIGWVNGNAYYFIDSINIICIEEGCFTGDGMVDRNNVNIFQHSETLEVSTNGQLRNTLFLINVAGQIVSNQEFGDRTKLDISKLDSGLYIAIVRTEHFALVKKIVVN